MKRTTIYRTAALLIMILALPALVGAQSWRSTVNALQNAFRDVSEEVLPVVVELQTVNVVETRPSNSYQFFFGWPFGNREQNDEETPQPPEFRQPGLGSGVLVEKRRNTYYVLTNNHVIEEADEIKVVLNDGREYDADLVGGDALKDLALVKFTTREDLPLAKLGNSDDLFVGEWVLAIGNPYGFESTVTSGIVSAIGRNGVAGQGFTDYIQTDAAINQGNSGGALVNLDGEVVGINTWIASRSGGNVGLGFAIPIDNAKSAITDFIERGSVQYGWLGVNMGDPSPMLLEDMNLEGRSGAFVFNVYKDSPAMDAGVRPGDLIVSVGGRDIADSNGLTRAVATLEPGSRSRFDVIRDGRELALDVRLGTRDPEVSARDRQDVWPGFTVATLTPELRQRLDLPRNAGNIIIGAVTERSPAAVTGLKGGDVIKSVNGQNVRDLKDFYRRINDQDRMEIVILRQGYELEFVLRN